MKIDGASKIVAVDKDGKFVLVEVIDITVDGKELPLNIHVLITKEDAQNIIDTLNHCNNSKNNLLN